MKRDRIPQTSSARRLPSPSASGIARPAAEVTDLQAAARRNADAAARTDKDPISGVLESVEKKNLLASGSSFFQATHPTGKGTGANPKMIYIRMATS